MVKGVLQMKGRRILIYTTNSPDWIQSNPERPITQYNAVFNHSWKNIVKNSIEIVDDSNKEIAKVIKSDKEFYIMGENIRGKIDDHIDGIYISFINSKIMPISFMINYRLYRDKK